MKENNALEQVDDPEKIIVRVMRLMNITGCTADEALAVVQTMVEAERNATHSDKNEPVRIFTIR